MLVAQTKKRDAIRDGKITKVDHKVWSFGDEESVKAKEAYRKAKKAKADSKK